MRKMVEFRDVVKIGKLVHKYFGANDNVSFEVYEGEFVCYRWPKWKSR